MAETLANSLLTVQTSHAALETLLEQHNNHILIHFS